MNKVSHFLIDLPATVFEPAATVEGHVLWDSPERPGDLTLNLGWWTKGLGTRDECILDQTEWRAVPRIGKGFFRFQLPRTPVSFSGRLISVHWALELSATEAKPDCLTSIVVSPTGGELDISGFEFEPKTGGFRFGSLRQQ